MKKKLIALLLTCTLIACCVAALAACNNSEAKSPIVYGKKYVCTESINEEEPEDLYYFVFNEDGKGTYYYKETRNNYTHIVKYEYKITFKYAFADNDKSAVICFYDSVINDSVEMELDRDSKPVAETETKYNISVSDWTAVVTISKDVLTATVPADNYLTGQRTDIYVNEDFAKTLENFNESTADDTSDDLNKKEDL